MAKAANYLLTMLRSFLRKTRSPPVRRKLLRSIIAQVVILVLLIHPATSQVMGSGTLFIATLVVALPPFLPASVHIFVMVALLSSLLFAWAWTCAATAAASAVRSSTLLLKQTQAAKSLMDPGLPAAIQEQIVVYSGVFLDPRTSVVLSVFFFVGTFFLATGFGYFPGFTILGIFALILVDSQFTTNALLPVESYLGPATFFVSSGCYAAVSIMGLVLIFPESFNHSWMITVRDEVLIPMIVFLGKDSDRVAGAADSEELISRLDFAIQMMEDRKQALNLEFSVHRLSPEEHFALFDWIKRLVVRVKNISHLQRLVQSLSENDIASQEVKQTKVTPSDDLYLAVFDACSDLKLACRVALMEVDEWIRECTKDSWSSVFSPVDRRKADFRHLKLDLSRSNLRKAHIKLLKKGRWPDFINRAKLMTIRQNHDMTSTQKNMPMALSLMDNVDLLAAELEGILTFLLDIEEREPKPRPRLPPVLAGLFNRRAQQEVRPASPNTPSSLVEGDEKILYISPNSSMPCSSSSWSRDPKMVVTQTVEITSIYSGPPSTASCTSIESALDKYGKSRKTSKVVKWLLAPVTVYAFRFGVLSVAIFTLAVSSTTVKFFNVNSGVLSLVLAQSYLTTYAGDQIYFFLVRFAGTLLGLLLVLPAWYVSAGMGTGNPYVFVVVTTIIIIPSLLVTVSTNNRSHLFFAMFASSTLLSTLTIIWGQTRAPTSPVSEIVFQNIWSRALLDLIGFGASLIVAMLPVPFTVRSAFHDTFAQALAELQALLRAGFEGCPRDDSVSLHRQGDILLSLQKKHIVLQHFTTSMKFDPRLSRLPCATYRRIFELQTQLVTSTIHYIAGLDRLERSCRKRLSLQVPSLKQSMVDGILRRIENLAETFAGSTTSLSLDVQGGRPDEPLDSLRLPTDLTYNQLLVCSTVFTNFTTIVESIRELELLLTGTEPSGRPRYLGQEVAV